MCRNSCKVQKYYDPDYADDDDYGQYPFTNLAGFWGPNWKVSFEVFINSFLLVVTLLLMVMRISSTSQRLARSVIP